MIHPCMSFCRLLSGFALVLLILAALPAQRSEAQAATASVDVQLAPAPNVDLANRPEGSSSAGELDLVPPSQQPAQPRRPSLAGPLSLVILAPPTVVAFAFAGIVASIGTSDESASDGLATFGYMMAAASGVVLLAGIVWLVKNVRKRRALAQGLSFRAGDLAIRW